MAGNKGDKPKLKIVTPEFRASFVTLKKPKAFGKGEPKYSVVIVLPEDDEFWDKCEGLIEKAAEKRWEKVPKNLKSPIRDGDETEYEDWEGCKFMQVSSEERPQVIGADGEEITSMSEVYSGCWMRASIRAYAWHYPETNRKGVSFQLDNVMKTKDDEAFSGRSSAADDFADYVDEDDDDRPRGKRRKGRDRDDEDDDEPRKGKSRRDRDDEDERPRGGKKRRGSMLD